LRMPSTSWYGFASTWAAADKQDQLTIDIWLG
jgi:hypothetical protein